MILARNKEIEGVIQSIKSLERHFNRWYNYPYVILNDGDFDDNFKNTVLNHTSGTVEFGKVGPDMWGFPDWLDPRVATEGIAKQGDAAVMYGGLESYHKMCRFYSGYVNSQLVTVTLTDPASSSITPCYSSTTGIGELSPRLATSVISPSMWPIFILFDLY